MQMLLPLLPLLLLSNLPSECIARELHLTTSDDGYMTVIQGFASRLECVLNTCVRHATTVMWYKDDVPIFNATKFLESSGIDPNSVLLQHNIEIDREKECLGTCSDSELCADGFHCVDNKCCHCASEDFTLVLKNLTFDDAGRYRCQISNQPQELEFQLEVLESGFKGGFHENISYDYSECCAEKGISPLCRAMCKPKDMHIHHFDPTSCKTDDYRNFLSCATDGGNRSHVQCCKTQLVPSFCYDFCSGSFQMLRKSHRLCLYYLPEIFECYNRAYLPFPDHPQDLMVNAIGSDELRVCWRPPGSQSSNKHLDIDYYTVYYKQIPTFPFLGGDDGIPLLSGDYEESLPGGIGDEEVTGETALSSGDTIGLRRGKRQTWLFVTHDSSSNDSTVREFKFDEVNTTNSCVTLTDLRSATRYIVYVTATNAYGTSVPSSRALAATNAIVSPSNATLPQIEQCCSSNNVSPFCASKMCDIRSVPNALETIAISTSCRTEWSKVSPCLADGRNHTDCCVRKGVQHDCLKICGGVPEPLSMHSLLCLNLDIAAIYQCLRQGYENRPSPPQNVTVTAIRDDSVEVSWDEPAANAHMVHYYTLHIWKNDRSAEIKQVHNVTSPHIEYGLLPDTEYTVYLQSHGAAGDSLTSTAQVFITKPVNSAYCPFGEPLYQPDGYRYYCGAGTRDCPPNYACVVAGGSETDTFCCSKSATGMSPKECCAQRGVPERCLTQCMPSTALSSSCADYGDIWVQCTSEGHDHSRCCIESNVPEDCMSACRHPFTLSKQCAEYSPALAACFATITADLPLAVRGLEVSSINATSVALAWKKPPHTADNYEINVTTNFTQFLDLDASTNFTARVITFNKFGSSPASFNITFETLQDSEHDEKPFPPSRLRVAWNHARRINITWDFTPIRFNQQAIETPITFVVNHVATVNGSSWVSAETHDKWFVMENLKVDSLYEVYVYATDGNVRSPSSSVITILAAEDDYALPEPMITLTPEYANLTYTIGQKIDVMCTVNSEQTLNVDLLVGQTLIHSDPPEMAVKSTMTVDDKSGLISCTVMDTFGRQNRAHLYIFVQFGPEVSLVSDQIYAYDDMSAKVVCIVRAYPEPQVQWLYRRSMNSVASQAINDPTFSKKISPNQYQHTLLLVNVTDRDGIYTCKATGTNGVTVSRDAELGVAKAAVPLTPRFISQCCVDAKVSEKCLKVCSVNPEIDDDCSQFSEELIKCASDGRDHRECCIRYRVPSDCLSLCSTGQSTNNALCSIFAPRAVACMIRGHERAPTPPAMVHYTKLSPNSIKVEWKETDENPFKVYAVYYRPENAEGDFSTIKTDTNEVVIRDLDPNVNYDLAVVSANALTHSPFVELKVQKSDDGNSSSGGNSFITTFFFIVVIVSAVSCLAYMMKTNNWSKVMQKLQRSHQLSDRDPTVAFENPGFGNEVHIRGLTNSENSNASDWQNANLEVAADSGEINNGMRYAKLNTS